MGVLSCSRSDCENIMCDRHSSEFGYICGECFDELVAKGSGADVAKFMESPKPFYGFDGDAAEARFASIFRRSDQ